MGVERKRKEKQNRFIQETPTKIHDPPFQATLILIEFQSQYIGLKKGQITWRMLVRSGKDMNAFYKATGTKNTEVLSGKKSNCWLEFYTLELALTDVIESKFYLM